MAGVPAIMRLMFECLAKTLPQGAPVLSRSLHAAGVREGDIAAGLTDIQNRYPGLDIGSYPYFRDQPGVAIVAKGTEAAQAEAAIAAARSAMAGSDVVAKGTDAAQADAAIAEIAALLARLGSAPIAGEPG